VTVHNSGIYKIGKIVLKDAPEAMKILDEFERKLVKYSILVQVRLVLREIKLAKSELQNTLDNAAKIVKNKGMVKE
jgi:deoxyadenosine/deoxycytidine kinase